MVMEMRVHVLLVRFFIAYANLIFAEKKNEIQQNMLYIYKVYHHWIHFLSFFVVCFCFTTHTHIYIYESNPLIYFMSRAIILRLLDIYTSTILLICLSY